MSIKAQLLCWLTLLSISVSAQSVYYVAQQGSDSNSGLSRGKAFASINQAASVTQPGDTVIILPGTYRGTNGKNPWDEVLISRSGRSGKYITYRGQKDNRGNRPRLMSSSVAGISVVGASYIIVEGLEVVPSENDRKGVIKKLGKENWQQRRGVSVANRSHHVILRDLFVRDFPGHGISTIRSDVLLFEDNLVEHCTYQSPNANSGITIFEPTRLNVSGFAKYPRYRIICRGNTSRYNVNLRAYQARSDNALVDGHGIILDRLREGRNRSGKRVPYTGRVLVAENICYGNGGYGINVFKSNHVDVYNNTLYDNAQSTRINSNQFVYIRDAQLQVGDAKDINVANNILANTNTSPTTYNKFRATNLNFRNNVHWNQSGKVETVSNGDFLANPQFVGARPLRPDQTRVLATPTNPFNPNSTSARVRTPTRYSKFPVQNLRVRAGSPAIDAGASVDIRAVTGRRIDVGAFEHQSGSAAPAAAAPAPASQDSQGEIVIRAQGDCGSETMELYVDDKLVQTWKNVSTSLTDYTYQGFSGGEVRVHFANDRHQPGRGGCEDRNLKVDLVRVCGTIYQTEDVATMTATCCRYERDKLYTNGNFNFKTLACNSNARQDQVASKVLADSLEVISGVEIYPNPAETQVTVEGPENYELTLYDLRGATVEQTTDLSGLSQLDVTTVKPGVYLLRLRDLESQQTHRQRLVIDQ